MPADPVSHLALLLFLPAATTVSAALMTPGAADAWAAAGAMLGTFVAVVEASQKRRGWLQLASIVAASTFSGSTLPGALVAAFLADETKRNIAWQSWSIAGFVCANVGWGLVLGVIHWGAKRAPAFAENGLDRLTNYKPNTTPDDRNQPP